MTKKTLLITHTDLDGVSPIILLELAGVKFDYKTVEISDIMDTWNELIENDELKNYELIYVCDLTLPQAIYDYINENHLNIKVFDHHETHLYANEYDYVDVKVNLHNRQTCATELFYYYLKDIYKDLNKESIKEYVDYVRELDTYSFTSDIPREIDSLKGTYGNKDFIKTIVRRLKKNDTFKFTSFEKRFTKIKKIELQRYLEKKEKYMLTYKIENHDVGVVFAESNKSDLGNYLAVKHPELEFIILIDASSRISYRASRDDVNVSEFASHYNGGGHRKASGSGFSDVDRDKIVRMYFNDVKDLEINVDTED